MGHLISTNFPDSETPSGLPPRNEYFGCGHKPSSCTTSPCLCSYKMRASSSYFSPCRVASLPSNLGPFPHFLNKSWCDVSYLFTPIADAASEAVSIPIRRSNHSCDFWGAYSKYNHFCTFGCILDKQGILLLSFFFFSSRALRNRSRKTRTVPIHAMLRRTHSSMSSSCFICDKFGTFTISSVSTVCPLRDVAV